MKNDRDGYEDLCSVATEFGFEKVYEKQFNSDIDDGSCGHKGTPYKEKEVIFAHKERGLLLYGETFLEDGFNTLKLYGDVIRDNNDLLKKIHLPMTTCGYEDYITIEIDMRSFSSRDGKKFKEAIETIIENNIQTRAIWGKPYNKRIGFWIRNYVEKYGSCSHDEITRNKLKETPNWVKQMVGFKPGPKDL